MPKKKIITDKQTKPPQARRAFFGLSALFVGQIAFYGFLVNSSVGNVVNRISIERQTGELVAKVSKLESTYFLLQNSVTSEAAKALDYRADTVVHYVDSHGAPVTVLSLSN